MKGYPFQKEKNTCKGICPQVHCVWDLFCKVLELMHLQVLRILAQVGQIVFVWKFAKHNGYKSRCWCLVHKTQFSSSAMAEMMAAQLLPWSMKECNSYFILNFDESYMKR